MPRYYFDWHEDSVTTRDSEGIVLPDLETAKAEAARGIADGVIDMVKCGSPSFERRELGITVRGEDQVPLFTTSMVFDVKLLGLALA